MSAGRLPEQTKLSFEFGLPRSANNLRTRQAACFVPQDSLFPSSDTSRVDAIGVEFSASDQILLD